MKTLTIEPLTAGAFAPFGEVIDLGTAHHYPINLGTTERFHDLLTVDTSTGNGRTLVNLFRGQPRKLPFEITMMERHPLGSQAFLPLSEQPYLIVVAEKGPLVPENLRAFITCGWQGVNYAKDVWHHPLLALDRVSDFIVIDRGEDGGNLVEENLSEIRLLRL
ncbi:MAG: ureidoglycolate lyase [Luteolibacter sp.]